MPYWEASQTRISGLAGSKCTKTAGHPWPSEKLLFLWSSRTNACSSEARHIEGLHVWQEFAIVGNDPRKERSSVTLLGVGASLMAVILSSVGCLPVASIL